MTIIDSIQKRPAMFIGNLSICGFKRMLSEFFNDILKKNTDKIEIFIDLKKDNWIHLKIKNINTTLFIETLDNLYISRLF